MLPVTSPRQSDRGQSGTFGITLGDPDDVRPWLAGGLSREITLTRLWADSTAQAQFDDRARAIRR